MDCLQGAYSNVSRTGKISNLTLYRRNREIIYRIIDISLKPSARCIAGTKNHAALLTRWPSVSFTTSGRVFQEANALSGQATANVFDMGMSWIGSITELGFKFGCTFFLNYCVVIS